MENRVVLFYIRFTTCSCTKQPTKLDFESWHMLYMYVSVTPLNYKKTFVHANAVQENLYAIRMWLSGLENASQGVLNDNELGAVHFNEI